MGPVLAPRRLLGCPSVGLRSVRASVPRPGGVPEWAGLRAGWLGGGGLDAPCGASQGRWEPAGDAGFHRSGPRRRAPGPGQPG